MHTPTQLLARLDAIGAALSQTPGALALIGLGSAGAETDRMDNYSDLDFFVIVAPDQRAAFLGDLGWCAAAGPVAFAFLNTIDGYKLLYEDGIFCEFAVFDPEQLAGIPFAAARVVWAHPEFDRASVPAQAHAPADARPAEWLLGEALTNLFVGMARYRRGERLSAARFIQGYALDRVIDLASREGPAGAARREPLLGRSAGRGQAAGPGRAAAADGPRLRGQPCRRAGHPGLAGGPLPGERAPGGAHPRAVLRELPGRLPPALSMPPSASPKALEVYCMRGRGATRGASVLA